MPMPSFLETLSRIQSANQNELTKIAYKMINVMKHFATDFQEFKASTAERIDNIECLYYEKMLWDMTVQRKYTKQLLLLQNENNTLMMESESLPKITELLSVQEINTHEINDNAVNS